jgi:hypothetical protein
MLSLGFTFLIKIYNSRGNIMRDEKNNGQEFLAVHIAVTGQHGAMMSADKPCNRFVNYKEINISGRGVKYLVYKYYENSVYGYIASSDSYQHYQAFDTAFDRLTRIPINCPQEEIDEQIYQAMKKFGDIQKIEENGTRYDLKEEIFRVNFFSPNKILTIPTENDPLARANLEVRSFCVLL